MPQSAKLIAPTYIQFPTMASELVPLISYLMLWVAICTAILWIGSKLEEIASPQMRSELVAWLERKPTSKTSINRLPAMYTDAFDRFFGMSPFSWRYFRRSVTVTVVFTSIVLLIWATTRPADVVTAAQKVLMLNSSALSVPWATLVWLAGAISVGAVPDYFSLIKSRALIGAAARSKSPVVTIVFLVADVLLSAALGLLVVVLFATASIYVVQLSAKALLSAPGRTILSDWALDLRPVPAHAIVDMLALKGDTTVQAKSSFHTLDLSAKYPNLEPTIDLMKGDPRATTVWKGVAGSFVPVGVNFYATFASTIWMAMFAIASAWVRAYPGAVSVIRLFRWALNVKEKPFQALVAMIAVWLSAGFALGLLLFIPLR